MAFQIDITVISGVSAGDVFHFDLTTTPQIVIGRDISTQLTLQDSAVSRRHALIERRADGFYIVDTNSSHGTVHMGFQLRPGPEGGRKLESGDEFKIGETKFRAVFLEELFQKKEAKTAESLNQATTKKVPIAGRRKIVFALLGVVMLGALYALLAPSPQGLPQQLSNVPLSFPQMRVLGNLRAGSAAGQSDQAHLDKVMLRLPTSDLLVEYEYQGQSNLEVLIDTIPVDQLKPETAGWRFHQLVIRDPLAGQERKLVFDNLDYPRKPGQTTGKQKLWAVRNLRVTPLTRELNSSLDQKLNACLALAPSWDKSPEGAIMLVRTLQAAVLEAMNERGQDGVGISISLDLPLPTADQLSTTLMAIQDERLRGTTPAQSDKHIEELIRLTASFDAEIWRRVNSRINTAARAAKLKNHIDAHDALVAVKKMFPDEADHRWSMADKMLNDNNIVPAKVRAKPEKFRKAKRTL